MSNKTVKRKKIAVRQPATKGTQSARTRNVSTSPATAQKAGMSKASTNLSGVRKGGPRKVKLPKSSKAATLAKSISGIQGQGLVRLGNKPKLKLRDQLAMTRPEFSRLMNVSERTIADAEAGKNMTQKLWRTYTEVNRLCNALSDVVAVKALGPWFQTPNPALDGLKPLEVVERGEIDRLWNMAFALRSGMPG